MKNQNHTSHIALHTSQKGITLIALIITIIVMLILVGVTINVALSGGLFTKASDASKQMQVEAEKEELLSSVVAAIGYDGKVVLADIELPTGWTGSNGTYTSPKGNTYTVDENGKIESGETKPVEPPTLELVQIDAGTYTDHTLIGLNVTFNSFEPVYNIWEEYYRLAGILEEGKKLEDLYLELYNEAYETNYKTIEETGKTLEEIFEELMEEQWEEQGARVALYINLVEEINIKRPDNTESTFSYDGESYDSISDIEGIYYYDSLKEEECQGYCYSATQTGTYEITITFDGYVLTDTITIEEF